MARYMRDKNTQAVRILYEREFSIPYAAILVSALRIDRSIWA